MDMYVSLDPRRSERPLVDVAAVISHPRGGRRFAAEVVEISCEGCRLKAGEEMAAGDQIVVAIVGLARWPARVIWTCAGVTGVEFHTPLRAGEVARYAEAFPPERWVYTESLRYAGEPEERHSVRD